MADTDDDTRSVDPESGPAAPTFPLPHIPEGLKRYASDVALPITLPIRAGAEGVKALGKLVLEGARARGYIPEAAPEPEEGHDTPPHDEPEEEEGHEAPPSDSVRPPPRVARGGGRVANDAPPTDRDDEGNRIEPQQAPAAPAPTEQQFTSSGVSPAVAKYLAQKMADDNEMRAAQKKANLDSNLAIGLNAANNGWRRAGGLAERDIDPAELAAANKPVSDILARRTASRQGLADFEGEQKFGYEQRAQDPNDPMNGDFRKFFEQSTGQKAPASLTISQFPTLGKPFMELYGKREEYKAQAAREDARDKGEMDRTKYREEHEDWRAQQRAKSGADDKPVSDRVTANAQGVQEILEAADERDDLADKAGVGSALNPSNNANPDFRRANSKTSQSYAKMVHGGPSESASKEFEGSLRGPYAPVKAIKDQNNTLRAEAIVRGEAMNEIFINQGKKPIIPPAVLERAKQKIAQAGYLTKRVGGRMFVKPPGGTWHEVHNEAEGEQK